VVQLQLYKSGLKSTGVCCRSLARWWSCAVESEVGFGQARWFKMLHG